MVIFIERGTDPLDSERIEENAHGLIGLLAAILAFIQPFMAFFRPGPKSSNRWIFNLGHFSVGMAALILASTAIILATSLEIVDLEGAGSLAIVIGFIGLYVGSHLMGTVVDFMFSKNMSTRNTFIYIVLAMASIGGLAFSIGMIYLIADDHDHHDQESKHNL